MRKLPKAERIEGIRVESAATTERCRTLLQYTDHQEGWHEIEMPLSGLARLYTLVCYGLEEARIQGFLKNPQVLAQIQKQYPEIYQGIRKQFSL